MTLSRIPMPQRRTTRSGTGSLPPTSRDRKKQHLPVVLVQLEEVSETAPEASSAPLDSAVITVNDGSGI